MKNILLLYCFFFIYLKVYSQQNHPFHLFALNGSNGFTIEGEHKGDLMGASLSNIGDINNDGLEDIALGAYLNDANGLIDAGKVYIIFGTTNTSLNGTMNALDLMNLNGFTITGKAEQQQLGWVIDKAGDMNGDGFDDFMIGAPSVDVNNIENAGEVYVIFGKAGGFGNSFDLTSLNGTNGFTIQGVSNMDNLGYAVAGLGDINGDNFDDILVGAPSTAANGALAAGKSYVIFGKNTSYTSSLSVANLDGDNGFSIEGIDAYDFSGFSVGAAGDMNGDGFDDFLIGAYGAEATAGESYLIFGHSDTYSSIFSLSNLRRRDGVVFTGINTGDFSGRSISGAGDINSDGYDDIIIGAPTASTQSGAAYVVFGNDNPPRAINLFSLDGNNGFTIQGADDQNYFATAVANAGDVNQDGIDDLLIGARFAATNGIAAGSAYLIFGKQDSFNSTLNVDDLNNNNGITIVGKEVDNQLGAALSTAGDFNGDGAVDLLLGAKASSPNGISSGASYLITDLFACTTDAGYIEATTTITSYQICKGTDLVDEAGHSVTFMPDYSHFGGHYDPSIGFDHALLLVDGNNTIVQKGFTAPYDFDFSVITEDNYYIYSFVFQSSAVTIQSYLNTIQTDNNPNDIQQIIQDDNDRSSGGTGTGNYCLDLNNTDANGNNIQIILNTPPTLSSSDIFACEADPLTLTVNSTATNLTFEWIGPNNFSATEQNPIVTNLASTEHNGIYTVTATDSNNCTNTTQTTVNIDQSLFFNSATPTIEECTGSTVELSTQLENRVTVNDKQTLDAIFENWYVADGTVYPQFIFPIEAILEDIAENGSKSTITTTLQTQEEWYAQLKEWDTLLSRWNPNVENCPDPSTVGQITTCLRLTYPLTVALLNESDQNSFNWTKSAPNFPSNEQNPIISNITPAYEGDYSVQVTSRGGCTATDTVSVTVHPLPIVMTNDIVVKEGEAVQLKVLESACIDTSNTSANCPNYHWEGMNDYESNEQNPRLTISATTQDAGQYTVYLTDDNNCKASSNLFVTVNGLNCEEIGLQVETADITIEENEMLQLSASLVADVTYQWSGPNNFSATEQNPIVSSSATLNNDGNYTVVITGKDNCIVSATARVVIEPFEFNCADSELKVEAIDSEVNQGATIQLMANTISSGVSYHWSGPNGFSSNEQNPLLTNNASLQDAGNYLVEVTDNNGCTEDDLAVIIVLPTKDDACSQSNITVNSIPDNNATIAAINTITTSGTVVVESPKSVIFQAGNTITLTPGFRVEAGASFSATIATCQALTTVPTTINKFKQPTKEENLFITKPTLVEPIQLQIFPNPSLYQTEIQVHVPTNDAFELLLYNSQGLVIRELQRRQRVHTGTHRFQLERNQLSEGIYLVVLKTPQQIVSKKLILLK